MQRHKKREWRVWSVNARVKGLNKTGIRWLVGVALAVLLLGQSSLAAALEFAVYPKTRYPLEERPEASRPNVLMLLDVGSAMTFSPNGVLPEGENVWINGKWMTPAELFQFATYGAGARPYSVLGEEQGIPNVNYGEDFLGKASRYGRDLDDSNNIIGDPNSYYTPYDGTYPENGIPGGPKLNQPYFLTSKSTLRYGYMSESDRRAGRTRSVRPGEHVDKKHSFYPLLVPNDSRMYIMKLVLWSLTTPKDPRNVEMFSRINVAMATTYQEDMAVRTWIADFYKRPDWDSTYSYPYGGGPDWAMGVSGSYYTTSQTALTGIDRANYESRRGEVVRQVSRAILRVPFGRFYEYGEATDHLTRFRQWIDGIEDIPDGRRIWDRINPELFADGKTPLATCAEGRQFFVGQTDTTGRSLIQFVAPGTSSNLLRYGTDAYINLSRIDVPSGFPGETIPAGQALGSAIDFFTPLPLANYGGGGQEGLPFEGSEGYFPITGPCQNNWLLIFTAGINSTRLDRSAPDAILDLYKKTAYRKERDAKGNVVGTYGQKVRGRKWNHRTLKWDEAEYEMEQGVRTLVVGFVDPVGKDAAELRKKIWDMARAGQPRWDPVRKDWVPSDESDPNVHPYFANDARGLLDALRQAFKAVDDGAKSSGSPLVQDVREGTTTVKAFYAALYRPSGYAQWAGHFFRYALDAFGNVTRDPAWDVAERLKVSGVNRNLWAWAGGGAKSWRSLSNAELGLVGNAPRYSGAFKTWFLTGAAPGETVRPEATPLGDMQHSNFLAVEEDKRVYIQTNRGVVHQIYTDTGDEVWGFVPPNVVPRLRSLRFNPENNWTWYGGDGEYTVRSIPTYLLDGRLSSKEMVFKDKKKHRVLVGTMGRGGAGVYAMDVTVAPRDVNYTAGGSQSAPKMLWAVDNGSYSGFGLEGWGSLSDPAIRKGYKRLGLTMQPGVLVSHRSGSKIESLCLLPAGVSLTLGRGDDQGKAVLCINPETGQVLHELRSPNMGMAVAPISYSQREDDDTKEKVIKDLYTADSLGNVYESLLGDAVTDWKLDRRFQVTTVAPKQLEASLADSAVAPGKGVAIVHGLLGLKLLNGDRWLFGGTGDVVAPALSGGAPQVQENPQQFLFGLNLSKLTNSDTMASLLDMTYFADSIVPSYSNVAFDNERNRYTNSDKGWFLRLRPEVRYAADPQKGRGAEYISASPYFYRDTLMFATFVPRLPETSCDVGSGTAKLYMMDPDTGESAFNGVRYRSRTSALTFEGAKITGITAAGGVLYLGINQLEKNATQNAVSKLAAQDPTMKPSAGVNDTVIAIKFYDRPSPPDTNDMAIDVPYRFYWNEVVSHDATVVW